ncbi:phage tail sheath family protein [Kutzneria sp. CA-103260]|uniref:phage tail sheath family protein n=1 Tax=Kutzneria sp. CA-103260 TaxID=2802641 RepID=UPI001BAC4390|nr:phage tail sheath subtilisin-like domain-containing protein [Kutzneria sp. CA-103260]QUQ62588.1 phage tail sheath family protein [Kutzneria sp. CA-103260]
MPSSYLAPGVYMEEVSSGSRPIEAVGTAVAAFVGFAEKGPVDEPVLVTSWTQFKRSFGDFVPGYYLAHAVYGYFLNGGGTAYVVRVGGTSGDTAPIAELPSAVDGRVALTVSARQPELTGISVEVQPAGEPADDTFKLVVKQGGQPVETFDNVTTRRGANNVVTVVRQQSKLITVEDTKGKALAVPQAGEVALPGGAADVVSAGDYVGDSADRTGFGGLEAIDNVTMLCVPDLMAAYQQGRISLDDVKAVQLAMIAHCELMADRVAILDTPPGLNAQRVKEWRMDFTGYDSKYAAMYWPWVKVADPVAGKQVFVPPSGHMAGIWARNDANRGVHKAPANEVVRGAVTLELNITKGEHDTLNPVAVNCIRAFPGQGIRVWGARTLSSDPEWRYLNVRRLFNYVEKSILQGTNWVVFEPNDPKLWDSVKRTITMFLRRVWRDGALFGRTPAEAFFVKCDEENNPPESRDAGILVVELGIAPVKPAEFVVFRISQFSEGASLEE